MLGKYLRFGIVCVALALVLAALFAPLFGGGNITVKALGIICHQKPERALWVGAYPMALCARCFAIYAAIVLSLIAFNVFWRNPRTESYIFAGAGFAPIAIDSVLQGAAFYDVIALRLITGSLGGCAIALILHILLTEPKDDK